jgi:hypothetical protein
MGLEEARGEARRQAGKIIARTKGMVTMTGTAQRETPQVAIFWLVQATVGEARLLATGCPLDSSTLAKGLDGAPLSKFL